MKALLCLFFLSHSLHAESRLDADKLTHGLVKLEKKFLYLYDRQNHNKHAVKHVKGPLLPHRVYLKYDEDLHQWVFTKTDFVAQLPDPPEYLRPDTVTYGEVVGSALKLARFILHDDGTWMPTRDPEVYKIWIKQTPPLLKSYTFKKVEDHRSLSGHTATETVKKK